MKQYTLLRDNRQSGPYSLEEIWSMGLRPKDLLWVEGQSICWEHPTKMEEVKDAVKKVERVYPSVYDAISERTALSVSASSRRSGSMSVMYPKHAAPESFLRPMPQLKERYRDHEKEIWQRPEYPVANILNVAIVFICVTIFAFVIKKVVYGFDNPAPKEMVRLLDGKAPMYPISRQP